MTEKAYYRQSSDDVVAQLNTDVQRGLSTEEVAERLQKYGPNESQETERSSLLQKFIAHFKDFMIIVLMIAAVISSLLSGELPDAVVIMIGVVFNAVMGVFQVTKADEALE